MDKNKYWTRWVLQTAKNWEDMKFVISQTGIAHIDHEHKRMTDYMVEINKLLFELEKSFCPEIYQSQKDMMKSFYQYTFTHCNNEEKFIKAYNIPGLEIQKREHKKLLSIMKEIIFQFDTGRVTSAFRLRIRLLSLVVNHINSVDNEVFKFDNIAKNILDLISWDEINTFIRLIHIPIIDKQHKHLTEMIINLLQTLSIDSETELIKISKEEELNSVILFAEEHFNTEIDIIKKYKIPGDDIQDKQHSKFISYLKNTLKELKAEHYLDLNELKKELLLWWIKHINIFDHNTFRQTDWKKPILLEAKEAKDVTWLIAKMGIDSIDHDHLHFIELLFNNLKLFENPKEQSKESRIEGLNSLICYAKEHFDREELIMNEKSVLDREQHILEHKSIIKSLNGFAKLNNSDKVDLSSAFKRKILTLWISHINDTDTGTFGVSYE